jgi:hypothetical protein
VEVHFDAARIAETGQWSGLFAVELEVEEAMKVAALPLPFASSSDE